MATRRTSSAGAKKPATKKATSTRKRKELPPSLQRIDADIEKEAEEKPVEKASMPDDWEKQAREILEMAESSGLQENFLFKTTFDRYLTQVKILADLKSTIDKTETLVTKQYVKGRANLYANPAIREFTHLTDSANKTVQTLIKILNGFKKTEEKGDDELLKIINGDDDE